MWVQFTILSIDASRVKAHLMVVKWVLLDVAQPSNLKHARMQKGQSLFMTSVWYDVNKESLHLTIILEFISTG